MTGYRAPDGQDKFQVVLSGVEHEAMMAEHRRRVAVVVGTIFAAAFLALVAGETLFATLMFSIISVEVLGKVVSGAAFALMVPTVILATHVKLHYEADHFTAWWLKKLTAVGILFFVLGLSLMVGFSTWQAAKEAVSIVDAGPTGTLGGRSIGADQSEASGFASWIGAIPNGLLFLGLSFGMIITIYFASFCLGRALQAFNLLTQTPAVGKAVKAKIKAIKPELKALRALQNDDDAARWNMPLDLKHKFAREAHHASWKVLQGQLGAARRKFNPARMNDPLAVAIHDPEVESIPNRFTDEESFCRHLADQMDQMRIHNVLRVLTGLPENGDKK